MQSFFRRLFRLPRPAPRRLGSALPPRLEAFEDRCVPAAPVTHGHALPAGHAALTAHPSSPNSGVLLSETFSDGNDAGWSHMDSSAGQPWGPGSYDASSGAYRLSTTGAAPVDDPMVGTLIATWEGSRGDAGFGNGVGQVKVRANTQGTTAGILLRADDAAMQDYGFFGSTGFGTFYIERFDGAAGGQTIIAQADPAKNPFVTGQDYWIKAGVEGHKVWMKAWKVGDPEPSQPLLKVQDKTFGPADGTLLCVVAFFDPQPVAAAGQASVRVDATFDDVTFTATPNGQGQDAPRGPDTSSRHDTRTRDALFALLAGGVRSPGTASGRKTCTG